MKVNNKTSFKVCAHCWHTEHGRGNPEVISPGETAEKKVLL